MNQPIVKHVFASVIGGTIVFLILFLINKEEPNVLAKAICLGMGCAIGVFIAFRIKLALKRNKPDDEKMRLDNDSLKD